MGFTTTKTWADPDVYNYPLDQVISMAQEAIVTIQASLQDSYVNTVQNNPSYTAFVAEVRDSHQERVHKIQSEMLEVFQKLEVVSLQLCNLQIAIKQSKDIDP